MPARHDFWVLAGPDYAGKSSVLAALAARTDLPWRYVSYDDRFMPADAGLARRLRADVESSLPALLRRYSTDFALTLIQAAVLFLRDEAVTALADGPVLVDSYYYKFLAKCRLLGLVNEDFFRFWRAFPQPDQVVWLDVTPDAAWRRSGAGRAVNALETRGDGDDRTAFETFQVRLAGVLREELRHPPVEVVDTTAGIEATADAVATLMTLTRRVHA